MNKPYLIKTYSRKFLENEYKKCLSMTELCRKLGIHNKTLLGLFKYYGIKRLRKTLSENHKKLIKKALMGRPSPMKNKFQSKKSRQLISLKTAGKNNPFLEMEKDEG